MSNYAKYKDIGEEKISSEFDDKKYLSQSKNSRNYVQYKNLEDEKSMQINQSTTQGIPENHIAYNLKNDI